MDHRKKNIIYSAVLIVAMVAVWAYRRYSAPPDAEVVKVEGEQVELTGRTMGTTYSIKYIEEDGQNFQFQIDSLLEVFNLSLSTYIPESEISRFNREALLKFESPFFYPVLKRSKEIFEKTEGAFDPTIGPLVNAWGFGPEEGRVPSKAKVDSLLQLVNYDSIFFDSVAVCKMVKGMKLDFSAIAKGYGVDVVADYLMDRGIENLFVEIGGEVYAHGLSERGVPWVVGVNYPTLDPEQQQSALAIIPLVNQAIATSGNYRNYYEVDGVRYSHTISPVTGYPVRHSLLSASVFAEDCMTADAYATAFMVLGTEKAIEIDREEEDIEVYLIYNDEKGALQTYASPEVEEKIKVVGE
ncbi:FAD:protein FMN transferase [Nafulsella turpanensis]|uniref:FAD:protein FMN transferase n=1 Tax=Nafulsella turpanensis TaxID=1265690 RepID=UPI00035ECB89|nr:FAD:protein FMN transferase [Nafulsella turpanensis]